MTDPEQLTDYKEVMNDPKGLIERDQAIKARLGVSILPTSDPVRQEIESLTAHINSPEAYQEYYRTMRGGVCPEDQIFRRHEQVKRFAKIRELILERKHQTVLDLGCLDGWQLLNLAASGIKGVGVDLCTKAVDVAEERANKWGFDLTFVQCPIEEFELQQWTQRDGSVAMFPKFDAVLISEVLEHVLDPLTCLKTATKHLAPGGILYISVPATPIPHHGKLEDAREHLRVFSEQDLIDLAKQAGLHKVVDHELIEEQDQGQSYANRTISFRRATVSIHCGHVTGGWTPLQPESLGGSEEMVVKVAEAWAIQGHEVTVYKNGPDNGLEIGGVTYLGRDQNPKADRDVLILFKSLDMVHIPAATKVFWTTDLPAPGQAATFLPPKLMDSLDAVLCISEYHRQELLKACPWVNPTKTYQHWLGVDTEKIAEAVAAHPKVRNRVLYASSYDRGLAQLLEMWPNVKAQVPDAELHVTYGWDFWKRSEAVVAAPVRESMQRERGRIEQMLQQPGVVHLGRIAHTDALKEFAEAEVWAYPCTGGELCCKTALEAQWSGCYPVVVPTMVLSETVKHGVKCGHERFPAELVRVLKERPYDVEGSTGSAGTSWADMASYLWDVCGGKINTDKATAPTATAPIIEAQPLPDRFPVPSCTSTPPVKELSILMAVAGMPFDGQTDRTKDLGGSESAAIGLCRALAKRGHSVTVFSNLPGQPGKFDGVTYLPIGDYVRYASSTPHDISIIQREPTGFNLALQSKLNILWCHDLGLKRFHVPFRSSLWNVDYIVPVSNWHARQLCKVYDLPPEIMAPMRNGIDLDFVRKSIDKRGQKDKNAIVYASRPERGLDVLLSQVFPKLLERNPNLTLYVAAYNNTVESLAPFYQHCQQLMANLGPRAKWLGALKKSELYGLYSRARVLLYPSNNFEEVSCLTTMEAAACGLPVVASTLGALPETTSLADGFARLVEHPSKSATPDFVNRFVDAAWDVISDDLLNKRMSDAGRNGAEHYDWSGAAEDWEHFLLGAIELRSKDKLRLVRHWWRLGDVNGVEKILPDLTPEQTTAFRHKDEVERMEQDAPRLPTDHLYHAVANVAAQYKPKTIRGVGANGDIIADHLAQMLSTESVRDGKADFVVGVESLDCSIDPLKHIKDAEYLTNDGGHICFVTACPGVQQDRLHRGEPRKRRWVFDGHDVKEMLGGKSDLLAMIVEGGALSKYDNRPLAWLLNCYTKKALMPVSTLNLERRKWLQSPQLSLTGAMIVKNGESLLTRCLKSIAPYCDEIIVDDTGSTDTTPEILRRFGIEPGQGQNPLQVGFDAVRNRGWQRATGDFIHWIDADEELLDAQNLPKYLRWSIYNGFAIQQHHFSAVPANAFKPDLPVRFFRRIWLNGKETGIRCYGFVHEHPELALNHSVGQSIVLSDVHIAHDGYLTETGRRGRFDRNIQLMFRDRAQYPDRILGKFLMIRDWIHLARYESERNQGALTPSAIQYLETAIEAYRKDFLGATHQMATDGLQYYNEALQVLRRGFEVQIVLKVGGVDGQPREIVYTGRMADKKDLETLVMGGVRDLAVIWDEEYI
jgi:glycosyltransferase involved in cell wall biosynthesis/2-polyprenyl-3-methyl-5-hydroxy-6-metoxy-1,4-benzoquinol methylase